MGWGGGGGVVFCNVFVLFVVHPPPIHLRMPVSHLQVLLLFLSILSCLVGCASWVPMESETRHDTNEMCRQQRMAEPSDIAALNTRVLEELEMSGEIPESAGAKLVGKNLGAVWSGHSERATLPTGLAAMGFRVRIGIRWGDGARKARTPTSAATGPW